jgi:hypothetical protein
MTIENGALHIPAYHYFPNYFGTQFFAADWALLNDFERDQVAPAASWPSLPEVLDELAKRARELAQEAVSKPRIADKTTRDQRLRYFTQELSTYLRTTTGGPMHGCVTAITGVVFNVDVDLAKLKQLLGKPKKEGC